MCVKLSFACKVLRLHYVSTATKVERRNLHVAAILDSCHTVENVDTGAESPSSRVYDEAT